MTEYDEPEGSKDATTRREGADGRGAPAPPQAMEPVRVVEEAEAVSPEGTDDETRTARSPIVEVDVEREVIGTGLYRERHIVEEVVEEDVVPPTRKERRRDRRRRVSRARTRPRAGGGLRGTLGYKLFYDLVCNRVGLVLAGFGTVLLLFVMLYDPMRRVPLEFGPKHLLAVAVAGVIYGVGMVFEMLRAWSWECEGADEPLPDDGPADPLQARARRATGGDAPIPLVPEDALTQLGSNESAGGGGQERARRRRRGRGRTGG